MDMPPFYRVRQRFDVTSLADVAAAVRDEFSKFDPADEIRPGQTVAVGVASRGTHDLKILVTATVACLKSMGLEPFVIPAMGSHGGGTAETVVEGFAITNGYVTDASPEGHNGGAMHIGNGSNPTVISCSFLGNSASSSGSAGFWWKS